MNELTRLQNEATAPLPSAPQTAPAEPPPDAQVEEFKQSNEWFVDARTSDGQRRLCTKKQFADTLRKDILDGALNSASTVDVYIKQKEGKWSMTAYPLTQFAKSHFKLGVLYEPVWSHAMAGLKWGALIGVGLKFLDTLILLGAVDPGLAFLFVVVAAACAIPRFGFPIVIAVFIAMAKFTKANLFITLLAVMLIGSILGCLPGMAIGGAIGLRRQQKLPRAPDAKPEQSGLVLKAVVLPMLGAAALWAFYLLVFNPWMVSEMGQL